MRGHATHVGAEGSEWFCVEGGKEIHYRAAFLLGLGRQFSIPRLDPVLFHCQWSRNIMKLVVKATCVAHRLAVLISSPQSCCRCFAVRATCAFPSGRGKSSFRFDKGPILSIHLIVEAASITEVMPVSIPSPKGGGGGSTVYAFTPFSIGASFGSLSAWLQSFRIKNRSGGGVTAV